MQDRPVQLPRIALDEIWAGPRMVDPIDLDAIAARVRRLAISGDHVALAASVGIEVVTRKLPSHIDGEVSPDGIIYVRPHLSWQRRQVVVTHELAHILLMWFSPFHTHADVWMLTMLLLDPRPIFLTLVLAANDDAGLAVALKAFQTRDA